MNQQLQDFYSHLNEAVITTNDFAEGTRYRKREKVWTIDRVRGDSLVCCISAKDIYSPVSIRSASSTRFICARLSSAIGLSPISRLFETVRI